jgi:hypothetical protein
MEDRFARLSIPDERGLALVCYSDRGYVRQADIRAAKRISCDTNLACPDFIWIVFDPARLGEKLGKFHLCNGDNFTRVIDHQSSRARGTLV